MNKKIAEDLIRKNNEEHVQFRENINELHTAIKGDGNGNIGMEQKVDRMYEIFSGYTFTGKVMLRWIGWLGGASLLILELWHAITGKGL